MLQRTIFTMIGFAGLAVSVTRPAVGQLSDADRQGIQAVTDGWLKGVLNGDPAAVAATYTEDAMLLPPNLPAVQGRAAIQRFMAQSPKITSVKAPLVEMESSGNLAYVRGTYELTMVPSGAKAPIKETGKFIEIRRKEPDGAWRILRDFWNTDRPPGK